MTLRRERGRRERGFTLVELLIVLAIMTLGAAIAFPFLARKAPAAALAEATQEMRVALSGARSMALAEDRDVMIGGDMGGYRIDGVHHDFTAGGGVRVEIAGAAHISFFPSGGASGGRIVLRSAAARREIDIEALTGRAVLLP
jgi:general secretion pathway protein H